MTEPRAIAPSVPGAMIAEALLTIPIGWQDGYPPSEPHVAHQHNGGCALCRPDQLAAVRAVSEAMLEALRALPLDLRMEAAGMEFFDTSPRSRKPLYVEAERG